jgi:hypothetical protein
MEGEKVDLMWLVGGAQGEDCHERKVDRRHDDQDGDHKVDDQQAGVLTRFILMFKKVHDRPSAHRL